MILMDTGLLLSLGPRVGKLLGSQRYGERDFLRTQILTNELNDGSIVVLGVAQSRGLGPEDVAHQIRSIDPAIAIYVVVESLIGVSRNIRALARDGVDELFVLRHPSDAEHFVSRIHQRTKNPAPARVMEWMLENVLINVGFRESSWTLMNAFWRPNIGIAAQTFGMNRNTFARHLRDGGFLPFDATQRVGLLSHALELQHRTGCSRAQAARKLDFSDGSKLSRIASEVRRMQGRHVQWNLPFLYPRFR